MLSRLSFFYGWVVTGSAFVVLFLTYGVQYSFGVFLPAMLDELGWQRASLASAFSLYSMVYSSCSWLSGRLTDSKGPQHVIALGGLLLGSGIIATSQISAQWQLYVCYGLLAALGMSTAFVPCNTTIVKWFQHKRGLALGLASSGGSCGILVVPPVVSVCLGYWGWRPVYCACGIVILILLVGCAYFMVGSPEQIGLRPDGDAPHTDSLENTGSAADVSQPVLEGRTLQEVWRLPSFWLLALVFVIVLLSVQIPFVHIVTFAVDSGYSRTQGAFAVSLIGLGALAGNLVFGPLSDRLGRRFGFALSLLLQAVAFSLFFSAHRLWLLYLGALIFGSFYGGIVTLFPALIGDFFGRRYVGAIAGFVFAVAGGLGAWGPTIAGVLRDSTGNYQLAFLSAIGTSMIGLGLFLATPQPVPVPHLAE